MSGNQVGGEDEQVRKRAYELWEQEGKPEDRHEEFWHQAQAEITSSGEGDTQDAPSPAGSKESLAAIKTNPSKGA